MDPEATLEAAALALRDGEHDEAQELLLAYIEWRQRGGYEPPGGDEMAERLVLLGVALAVTEIIADDNVGGCGCACPECSKNMN